MAKRTVAQLRRIAAQRKAHTEAHLRMSIKDWRQHKRQQWAGVQRAMELFTYGSAYTPAGNDLYEMEKAAGRIAEAMREDWICW